jgi:hypothetical protein
MKTEDALYHAVHDYPGGATALAPRMQIAASTLQSTANPTLDSHQWSLRRAKEVIALTGDIRPLQALAAEFGGMFIRTSMHSSEALPEAFRSLAKLAAEFGDVARATEDAMHDGRISANDAARISTQCMELAQAAGDMMRTVDELAAQGPTLRAVRA